MGHVRVAQTADAVIGCENKHAAHNFLIADKGSRAALRKWTETELIQHSVF